MNHRTIKYAYTAYRTAAYDVSLGQLAACAEQAAQKRVPRFVAVNPAYTSQGRDYNAAVNILLLAGGHSESLNGPGGRVRRLELASPAPSAVSVEGATSFVTHRPRRRRTRAMSLARRARLKSQTSV